MMVIVMKSVLIISKTEQSITPLKELMKNEGYDDAECAFTSDRALELAAERHFDVVIINTPILDSGGIDLSVKLCNTTMSGVFVLLKSEVYSNCCNAVEEKGVFALEKPINRSGFHQCLRIWEISRNRLGLLEKENTKLKNQVEEIKIINRAKCTLMQCLTMSEEQAHRYLEKQAMDMRISKLKMAQRVLSIYEL